MGEKNHETWVLISFSYQWHSTMILFPSTIFIFDPPNVTSTGDVEA